VWSQAQAQAIADAVRGQPASVTEESKPTTQASPLLFDLTSLQREANGKFGFSAKTTLALAQSLYERHKALTYPRTDSRALPEDYLPVAKQTFEMLADSGMRHLAPFARQALEGQLRAPSKRIFDNSKVSDHFAIIPTCRRPAACPRPSKSCTTWWCAASWRCSSPAPNTMVTTRISKVQQPHSFKTEGKVLVKPGWLAIYGKEAADEVEGAKDGDKGQNLVPVKPGEMVNTLARWTPRASRPSRPHATPKPRCWAPWKARASRSTTTSCAKPCRKKAWARRPRARPPSKAC
jgi:DNA topoisomerase-3